MSSPDAPTEVRLGGYLCLRSSAAVWKLTTGTRPHVAQFDLPPAWARSLYDGMGPYTLTINPGVGSPVTVEQLWVLNVQPGPNPYISTVTVADRRWFWSYKHVLRRYNVPRAVGNKRVIDNALAAQPFSVAPDMAFAPYSIRDGKTPWDAFAMLKDVFEDVSKAEESASGGSKLPVTFDTDLLNSIKNVPVQNHVVDDAGDSAIMRTLAFFPEADVYIDYDGTAIVYSKVSGREKEIVSALLPEMREGSHTDLVENSVVRPKEVHVKFTMEIEAALKFSEGGVGETTTDADEDERKLINVLPIPDYQLTVSGTNLVQGSWTEINTGLFNGWGAMPFVGTTATMSLAFLRRIMMPFKDAYSCLQITGALPDRVQTLKDWPARISACTNHYRQTFQVQRKLMDRIFAIRPYRIATVNPLTKQRSPALMYGDYALIPSMRFNMRNAARNSQLYFAINKTAYPASGRLDDTANPSPGWLEVVDGEQGIIRCHYVTDPNRQFEMVLPSQIDINQMPHGNLDRQNEAPVSFNAIKSRGSVPRLASNFKLLTVLTVVPASPNDNRQLYTVKVKPSEIESMLPGACAAGLANARGPIMEIRIGPNVETARVQWLDSKSEQIERALGIRAGEPNLSGLVINDGESNENFGASLKSIARDRAAALYASLADRFEGAMVGALQPASIAGYAGEISLEIRPDGVTLTKAVMEPKAVQLNLGAFLDSNSRNAIFKLVAQEK